MTAEKMIPATFVVLWPCRLKRGAMGTNLVMLGEGEKASAIAEIPEDSPRIHSFTKIKNARPGMIVTMDCTPGGNRVMSATLLFKEWLPDNIVTQWQVRARSLEDAAKMVRETGKANRRDLPYEVLEPWRQVIRRSSYAERAALLARMIYYVETGKKAGIK